MYKKAAVMTLWSFNSTIIEYRQLKNTTRRDIQNFRDESITYFGSSFGSWSLW